MDVKLLRQRRYPEAERETLAGYGTVSQQADSSVNWLQNARQDLITEYGAPKRPEQVAKYQTELARFEPSGRTATRR